MTENLCGLGFDADEVFQVLCQAPSLAVVANRLNRKLREKIESKPLYYGYEHKHGITMDTKQSDGDMFTARIISFQEIEGK